MDLRSSLLRLPNELLLLIKDSIDHTDLLAHVCYYQLHSRTRACYASDDSKGTLWQTLLYENGLGIASFDPRISSILGLRQTAVECAEHAWQCKHPACGSARLQKNSTYSRRHASWLSIVLSIRRASA